MILYDAVALASGPTDPNGEPSAIGLDNLGDAVGGIGFGPGMVWFANGASLALDPLPNAKSSYLWAINDFRVAVGAANKDGLIEQYVPIMVMASPSGAQVTDLTALAGNAVCTGINNNGLVCGWRVDGTSVSGFVIDPGGNKVVASIPFPPGQSSMFPQSINDTGDVVVVPGEWTPGTPGAYVFRNFTDLIAVSNLAAPVQGAQRMNKWGQLPGFDDGSSKPVVWDTNTTPPTAVSVPLPPGFDHGVTVAINDNGAIVGFCWKETEPETPIIRSFTTRRSTRQHPPCSTISSAPPDTDSCGRSRSTTPARSFALARLCCSRRGSTSRKSPNCPGSSRPSSSASFRTPQATRTLAVAESTCRRTSRLTAGGLCLRRSGTPSSAWLLTRSPARLAMLRAATPSAALRSNSPAPRSQACKRRRRRGPEGSAARVRPPHGAVSSALDTADHVGRLNKAPSFSSGCPTAERARSRAPCQQGRS